MLKLTLKGDWISAGVVFCDIRVCSGGWQPPSPPRLGRGGWLVSLFLILCFLTSPFCPAGTYYPDEDKDNGHVNNDRTETINLIEGLELYSGNIYLWMFHDRTIHGGDIITQEPILNIDYAVLIIPEPASLMFLGLGGLWLRRRNCG